MALRRNMTVRLDDVDLGVARVQGTLFVRGGGNKLDVGTGIVDNLTASRVTAGTFRGQRMFLSGVYPLVAAGTRTVFRMLQAQFGTNIYISDFRVGLSSNAATNGTVYARVRATRHNTRRVGTYNVVIAPNTAFGTTTGAGGLNNGPFTASGANGTLTVECWYRRGATDILSGLTPPGTFLNWAIEIRRDWSN